MFANRIAMYTSFYRLCLLLLIPLFIAASGTSPSPEPRRDNENFPGQIPVLCYHQVREWKNSDSRLDREFIVPPSIFNGQVKALNDSGYHSISPDELLEHLTSGKQLPPKSFMITFDDANASQYDNALPLLEQFGFKATFFIMTVVLDHRNYLTREQVKELAARGHTIGAHTWDHTNVNKLDDADWDKQLKKPKEELEQISGKPVKYFAYPFGVWNSESISHLRDYQYSAAFRLSGKETQAADPTRSGELSQAATGTGDS